MTAAAVESALMSYRAGRPGEGWQRQGLDLALAVGNAILDEPGNGRVLSDIRSGRLSTHTFWEELQILTFRALFLAAGGGRRGVAAEIGVGRDNAIRVVHEAGARLRMPRLGRLWGTDSLEWLAACSLGADELRGLIAAHGFGPNDITRLASKEPAWLGFLYARAQGAEPDLIQQEGVHLAWKHSKRRKQQGSYYTPADVVEAVLSRTLDPVLAEWPSRPPQRLPRVLDPACGGGAFLVPAARRIIDWGSSRAEDWGIDAQRVLAECIFGADLDPLALDLCLAAFSLAFELDGGPLEALAGHLRVGDSLLGAWPSQLDAGITDDAYDSSRLASAVRARNRTERDHGQQAFDFGGAVVRSQGTTGDATYPYDAWCVAYLWDPDVDGPDPPTSADLNGGSRSLRGTPRGSAVTRIAEAYRLLHWPIAFPEVFSGYPGTQGFDVVVGNPPFLSQLSSATARSRDTSRLVGALYGGGGRAYSNTANLFLLQALRLAAPKALIGLLMPVSVLSARDASEVRKAVDQAGRVEEVWLGTGNEFDAGVHVCCPVISMIDRGRGPMRQRRALQTAGVSASWAPLVATQLGLPDVEQQTAGNLGSWCQATADFRDQYYGLLPYLVEDETGNLDDHAYPRVVTSGLIDPGVLLWGERTARIGGRIYLRPRADLGRIQEDSRLAPWAEARLTPKILVATQTRVLEACGDVGGRLLPVVPVISVSASARDVWHVLAVLLSPTASLWAMRHVAGAALVLDAIKLSASQIVQVPTPARKRYWDEAADLHRHASGPDVLLDAARLMCSAYGHEDGRVFDWWIARVRSQASVASRTDLDEVARV